MSSSCQQEIEDSVGWVVAKFKQPEKNGSVGTEVSSNDIRIIVTTLTQAYGIDVLDDKDELFDLTKTIFFRKKD